MVTKRGLANQAEDQASVPRTTQPMGSTIDAPVDEANQEPPSSAREDPPSVKEFDPFRFAVTELPTGMRQALIAAELPVVPKEQLFDTKPPNAGITAAPRDELLETPVSLPADVPAGSGLGSKRPLLVGVLVAFALAVTLALAVRSRTQQPASTRPTEAATSQKTASASVVLPLPHANALPPAASSVPTTQPLETPAAPRAQDAAAPKPGGSPSLAPKKNPATASDTDKPSGPRKKESALGSVLAPPPD